VIDALLAIMLQLCRWAAIVIVATAWFALSAIALALPIIEQSAREITPAVRRLVAGSTEIITLLLEGPEELPAEEAEHPPRCGQRYRQEKKGDKA
jgi:hypothetical protein